MPAFMGRLLKLYEDGKALAMEGDGTVKECIIAVGQGGTLVARAVSEFRPDDNPLVGQPGGPTHVPVGAVDPSRAVAAEYGKDAIPGTDVDAVPGGGDAIPPGAAVPPDDSALPDGPPKPRRRRTVEG